MEKIAEIGKKRERKKGAEADEFGRNELWMNFIFESGEISNGHIYVDSTWLMTIPFFFF